MGKVEELPDDFDESLNLNKTAPNKTNPAQDLPSGPGPSNVPSLESLINDAVAGKGVPPSNNGTSSQPSAPKPPAMEQVQGKTADEVLAELNRTPLFMTSLDETDGAGGGNDALEALKAMAYEGTKAECAGNFREQGNECAKAKQWSDARGFYTQAIDVLHGPDRPAQSQEEGEPDMDLAEDQELDPEEEARKEKAIEEASYVNRALCNLEMSQSAIARPCSGLEMLTISHRKLPLLHK